MGKYSYIDNPQAKLIPGLYGKVEELKKLSDEEMDALWVSVGKPLMSDYGFEWFSGKHAGNHYAGIDDSRAQLRFQIYCRPVDDYYNELQPRREYWMKLACVLAHQVGLKKLTQPVKATVFTSGLRTQDTHFSSQEKSQLTSVSRPLRKSVWTTPTTRGRDRVFDIKESPCPKSTTELK